MDVQQGYFSGMVFAVDVETFNSLYNNEYCKFCRTSGKHRVKVELSSSETVSNSPIAVQYKMMTGDRVNCCSHFAYVTGLKCRPRLFNSVAAKYSWYV